MVVRMVMAAVLCGSTLLAQHRTRVAVWIPPEAAAPPGGSAYSVSTSFGTITIPDGSSRARVLVTSNLAKTFLHAQRYTAGTGGPQHYQATVKLYADSIVAERVGTSGALNVTYTRGVLNQPGDSVWHGSVATSGGSKTIYRIYTGRNFGADTIHVITCWTFRQQFSTATAMQYPRFNGFSHGDSAEFVFGEGPYTGAIEADFVRYDSCTVTMERSTQYFMTRYQTVRNDTTPPYVLGKTWTLPSYGVSNIANASDLGSKMLTLHQTGTERYQGKRSTTNDSSQVLYLTTQVVVFDDGTTVGHDTMQALSGTYTTVTHSATVLERTLYSVIGYLMSAGAAAPPSNSMWQVFGIGVTPQNTTSYRVDRGATGSATLTFNLDRVQFGGIVP